MRNGLFPNLILLTVRNPRRGNIDSFFVGNTLVDKDGVSPFDNVTFFPLYTYPTVEGKPGAQAALDVQSSHWSAGKDGRNPNFNPELVADLEKRLALSFVSDGKGDLKKNFGPEDIFNYIYAVFYSPTYRTRYAEFLKSDFPRVPLTSDVKQFRVLCGLGAELVALHLLESPKLGKPIARYPLTGPNIVEKGFPKYLAPGEPEPGTGKPLNEGRVYISRSAAVPAAGDVAPTFRSAQGVGPNGVRPGADLKVGATPAHADLKVGATNGQYFEGVPPEVWNFQIGGYQVCEKWLKDRRGRTLTYEDLEHYRKVVTALSETIRLMAEIDAAIPNWPLA